MQLFLQNIQIHILDRWNSIPVIVKRFTLRLHHTSNLSWIRRPKKFLFIVDVVLVFWLLFFAFLKRLNHNLCAESLKFCMRQWPPYCLHLFKLENIRLTFFKFRLTARACADHHSVPLSLHGLSQARCFTNWGEYKSYWMTTNQIKFKFWFLVRGENQSTLVRNPQEQSREPTKSTHVWRREQNRTRAT